ncbi:TonB-dependent receptor [Maricaulis maris]|uniref:TonB-dependent receptor n=1 Tax=Maricaulis maris TaxID=74318 RepID=A0A495DLA2_9PROT|nr:TonB-dependent receptor [Maricaulis maris]RKR03694.1 TonB-dependent receptor [Maricaulis maris]
MATAYSNGFKAALLIGSAVLAAPAVAQDQAASEDVVTVYGQALSIQRAIEAKREADGILDAVAQDDIGRLPDLNIAQAIVRVPGVAVQNDQGESRFPIIRGLNATYNRTTIDGGIVASPERGGSARAVPLDLIPASLVGSIEVRKSVTPDLDHNAIGGTINLVTRSAFDSEDPFFVGGLFLGRHESAGSGTTLDEGDQVQPWRGNFAAGTTFGPNDQFGVVFGIDYSIRNFEITQVEVDDADYTEFDATGANVGLGNGNGFVVPTNNRLFLYNNVRERLGLSGQFEWRASDALHLDAGISYNQYNDSERRDEETYELGTSGASSQPAVIRDQTATSGITDTGYGFIGIGRFVLDREILSLRAGADWVPAENWLIEANLVYTEAELDNPEVTEGFRTGTGYGARYDTSQFFNTFSPLDPAAYNDLSNWNHVNRGTLDRFAEDETREFRLDATWTDGLVAGLTLKGGLLSRSIEKSEGFTFERFVADPAANYTLADVADPQLANLVWQGGYRFENRIGLDASDAFFGANTFNSVLTVQSGSSANEDVNAVYAMGDYRTGRWQFIGGVRIEQTEWDGAPLGGTRVSGDYTDVLPSLTVRFDLNDDVVLRAAASRTLGRPNLNELTRGESINLVNNTISRSNPDLAPRQSTNFDLSAEWYIPHGILAAGLFYKDIQDEVFVQTTQGPITVDGVTYDALTQPENATGAEILGFEAQYQQTLAFLPGPFSDFGVAANVTILDTEFEVPTATGSRTTGYFQQPDLTYNLTGFYATEAFEVRVSYNFTDMFLDTMNANNPNLDEYWEERSQVDLQARFNLTDRFTLIGEVQNLTDQGRRELTGPDAQYLQEDAEFGRTFWVGFTGAFN